MSEISLFEANRHRAQLIAAHCVERMPFVGLWGGYTYDEDLVGELTFSNLITYWRKSSPMAKLVMWEPKISDIKEVDWGEEKILESNVIERYSDEIIFDKEIDYEEELSYTFSETRTLLEQAKVGAEAAIRGLVSGSYSGVKAELEVSAKITSEYSRQWGKSVEVDNTVKQDIKIKGPITIKYEAERSIDKLQRHVIAKTDFEYSIGMIDETGAGVNPPRIDLEWRSWQEFLALVKGEAPRSYVINRGGHDIEKENPLYHEFLNNPLSKKELKRLEKSSKGKVSFLVEYDNVVHQHIKAV